jgi:DNA-binding NarL/FixJ family response regulator
VVDIEPTWRVLVVEDEALLAEETCERLKQMMYEVVGIADTGEKAVALAEQHKPDLVLMDIRLKGAMSGIEAANEIYERWGVPVIFTSAHSDRDTLRRAQTPAQFGYIVKPLRANDLSTAIRLAMHRFHAEKSMQTTRLTYGAILSSITEGVVVTDAEGAIRFMNYRAEELLEWHIADAFG